MSGNLFYPKQKHRTVTKIRKQIPKTAKQLERHLKGVANHRRIQILFLISENPGISVEGISNRLGCNFKTISEHIRRLVLAGLAEKKYQGNSVSHSLTPYGKIFMTFLNSFSYS